MNRVYRTLSSLRTIRKQRYFPNSDLLSQRCTKAYNNSALLSITQDLKALEDLHNSFKRDEVLKAQWQHFMHSLVDCHYNHGRIYVTGIGKSGIVGRRLASSLNSLAIRSQWIHASEWVHGELGGLVAGDIIIILSHSGETTELLDLPSRFREKNCNSFSIIGIKDSNLSKLSDACIETNCGSDATMRSVPSRSIVVQEAICNAIINEFIITTIEKEGKSAFFENHPGGFIGQIHS